jgi:hypothetical protein
MSETDRAALVEKAIAAFNGDYHRGLTNALSVVIDLIRNETLEEAAKVAEGKTELYLDPDTGEIHKSPMPNIIATAIRALKTSSGASGS